MIKVFAKWVQTEGLFSYNCDLSLLRRLGIAGLANSQPGDQEIFQ